MVLNIEHRLVSIGSRENHDKEQFKTALVLKWVFGSGVGWLSKTSIVARDVIG